jgi:hypothetical protein
VLHDRGGIGHAPIADAVLAGERELEWDAR